jgi:hypothetical protein
MTAHQIYDETIKTLPAAERLQLATLILNDIPPQSVANYSDEWSEEDMRDVTGHSLRYAEVAYPYEPDEAVSEAV